MRNQDEFSFGDSQAEVTPTGNWPGGIVRTCFKMGGNQTGSIFEVDPWRKGSAVLAEKIKTNLALEK